MIKVVVCANSTVELARLGTLVKSAPSLELVGSILGRAHLSQQLADTRPDVLLERFVIDDLDDSRSPDLDAKNLVRVLLVAESEITVAFAVIRAADPPVRGVLPTWASAKEIQIAIEAAAGGLLVLHPDVAGHLETMSSASSHMSTLTLGQPLSVRESEVLNLLAAGLGNKEIARQLKISEHTVKFHVTSIFNKLNTSSRAEAVAVGVRRGLIPL